ncbi:DUF1015 family protein [uncultured Peptoniphilus sp.]|uniref:DUF1015 domain-containing protein n=1 Tax=uncultured Peptoniphilus sp. TaxID=254354 RepID=UPI002803D061|nr:DUF1015 family protein [uncultured Peptoniphilus sp.]
MVKFKKFESLMPKKEFLKAVSALPYDVFSIDEGKSEIVKNPLSFLSVDLPLATINEETSENDPKIYEKALENFKILKERSYEKDKEKRLYLYELTMNEKSQLGLVCCLSADDYQKGIIKRHEFTRKDKEEDRTKHIEKLNAHTGPVFLAFKENEKLENLMKAESQKEPYGDFISDDGVRHRVWKVSIEKSDEIISAFKDIKNLYIADGHHRCQSALNVCLKRRAENSSYDPDAEFNFFLGVCFPQKQLNILDYNRLVKDLNSLSVNEFLEKICKKFCLQKMGDKMIKPAKKGEFSMYLEGVSYKLKIKEDFIEDDPVLSLDVSILQNNLLDPILGIKNPRTDKRIDFVGGIRGLDELEKRTREDMKVAFALYPTSMDELFKVADSGLVMPPKSTWFEPKLRSGIFIHEI